MIGIDEVGRGSWAGPLVVGLVEFTSKPAYLHLLKDSKALSEKQREDLAKLIRKDAHWSLGWSSADQIDRHGLTVATTDAILKGLTSFKNSTKIVLDGSVHYLRHTKYESLSSVLPKADSSIPEVMAASIIAKVARDQYMKEMKAVYPAYGFEVHKGYGTSAHRQKLELYGVSPIHRKSYKPVAVCLQQH